MTFLEVLDDAVKIGLGAFSGWLIARGTRAHDFEKERRRRKQDFLEGAGEALDDLVQRMESVLASADTWHSTSEDLKSLATERLLKEYDFLDEAEIKFSRLQSKFALFGFPECTQAFKEHSYNTTKLKAALADRGTGGKDSVNDARKSWWESESALREKLVAVFRAL